MKAQIQPVTIFPDTATHLEIVGVNIRQLGASGFAILVWQLTNDSGAQLKTGSVDIVGSDYQGWNEDDPYLMDIVLAKLGLTRA